MPWCPKCKNEYVEGKTHCPDCDVDLVEELPLKEEESIDIPEDYEFPEDFRPEEILEENQAKPVPSKTYKSPEERYQDMRSSAYTFLFVGGLGILIMALALAGVLTFPFHDFALVVMLALFVVFLYIGVLSFKNSSKIKDSIQVENSLIAEVRAWYEKEGAQLESLANLNQELPQEILYFQKYDMIRQGIQTHFPELDETLLDKLTSDFCEEE
ncbi:MAG: hypothetical protein HFJ10_14275 [Lachnospiraceae bacterium]|jgi:hypothetical protein|nr:hypothetical protein [Lachnospiraceae bacterium]